jgi:hypothetical protein
MQLVSHVKSSNNISRKTDEKELIDVNGGNLKGQLNMRAQNNNSVYK